MALSNNVLNVTSLNFSSIRSNLKNYISSVGDFADYDFEGSTMSLLLDELAYNTYMNSIYTNMAINETFLDSAQIRSNIVSRAKMLGYTPTSARGATAVAQITVSPTDSPVSITVAKNTTFTSEVDGITYKFVTPQTYTILPTAAVYSANVNIVEGEPITHRYEVSTSDATQRFIIPNKSVDTTSLSVEVQTSSSNTTTTTFIQATDLRAVYGNSSIYFLQESENEEYELIFGDNVLGRALDDQNILIINYRKCHGSTLNGTSTFSGPSTVGGYSNYSFNIQTAAEGGADVETIESVRFNAPKHYQTQNRGVTAKDYELLIKREFPEISSLRVWGGENNIPSTPGRVFVAAKPSTALFLSEQRKAVITDRLRKFSIVGIETKFVDATYLYINPIISVKYDSDLTVLTDSSIRQKVETAISTFETSKLGTFDNNLFRFSKFVRAIDDSDASVLGNTVDIGLEKRFTPILTTTFTYTLNFNNTLEQRHAHLEENIPGTLSSTSFTYLGKTCFLDDNGEGIIRIYYSEGANRITLNDSIGTIDYTRGIVKINNFVPSAYNGSYISIFVTPKIEDVKAETNELLLFSNAKIILFDERTSTNFGVTTITTQGSTLTTGSNETGVTIFRS
jgi:hypothetical protein